MNTIQETCWGLASLSIYRGLLDCPVTGSYYRLLQTAANFDAANPEPFFTAWGTFYATACTYGAAEDLSGVITDGALYDDNIFSRRGAAGEEISDSLRRGVERDLSILLAATTLSPEIILVESGADRLPLSQNLPRWQVGKPVEELQGDLSQCVNKLLSFYRGHGCGKFVKYRAFIWREQKILPVEYPDKIRLEDLKGYEFQRNQVVDNTTRFLQGLPANNCLLYGDRGTGKSSTVKAIMNGYAKDGLRVIEMPKESLMEFPYLVDQIAGLPLKFIIFIDDLSFSKQDETYASLKAVLEGGVASRPDNTLIYATSNRRHLIKESWSDRDDMETDNGMHRSDTMQEKLSLVARFGVTIYYGKPSQKEYFTIVKELRKRYPSITLTDEELCAEANKWELSHGGISGRTAQQFINYMAGMAPAAE